MSDELQSGPGGAEGDKEELDRIDPVVEDFKDFSANLLDTLWPLHPRGCTCNGCPGNKRRSVSFQDLARLMDCPKVKVFVGAPRVCYVVPEKLLCEKSQYFRATFVSSFAEASSGVSSLPEIEAETFEGILKWMMSGNLANPKKSPGGARSFIDERVNVLPLVWIYFAAQHLALDELRKAAAEVFRVAVLDGV